MVNEQLSGMLGGLRSSTNSSLAAFAAMEEKVMSLEAEAEGAAMVRASGLVTFLECLIYEAVNGGFGIESGSSFEAVLSALLDLIIRRGFARCTLTVKSCTSSMKNYTGAVGDGYLNCGKGSLSSIAEGPKRGNV